MRLPISKTTIDKAQRADIISVIKTEGIKLRKCGKEYKGRCPFHEEKTPSFHVNPIKGVYHCFGCGASGNTITFITQYKNMKFIESVDYLLQFQGSSLSAEQPRQATDSRISNGELMNNVMEFYHRAFMATPNAAQYLADRGIKGNQLYETFKLGYAEGSLLHTLSRTTATRATLLLLSSIFQT